MDWFRFHNLMIGVLSIFAALHALVLRDLTEFFRIWLTGIGVYFGIVGVVLYLSLFVVWIDEHKVEI